MTMPGVGCSRQILILAAFIFLPSCATTEENSIKVVDVLVSDFGAVPNDGENDLPGLRAALEFCRSKTGVRLYLAPGRYDIRDEKAVELMESVMRGEKGNNPQDAIYRPYFDYVRGLDFSSLEDLVVEAVGAELIVDGWMEPVALENCTNITIRGLTIDYKRPPYSIGTVVNVWDGYFDVKYGSEYPLTTGMPIPRVTLWDPEADRMVGKECFYPEKKRRIGPQALRLFAAVPISALNQLALCNHSFHFRPAVFIHQAEKITLEKFTIHSQPGMGVIGHRSRNLTFRNLRIVPRAGSVMSTNTDATHFTSCSGYILFEGCQFEGQGDDSTNIHNYYYSIFPDESGGSAGRAKTCEIRVESPGGTHAQVLDYPDPGDILELVEKKTLRVVDMVEVIEVENDPVNWKSLITLDRELTVPLEEYYLINISRLPRVRIINCSVRSHRARAFLIKTRDVLIEGCTIENTTGTAIHVGAEGWWHEGPGSADVKILFNRIIHCGFGEGIQNDSSGIAVNVKAERRDVPGIHRGIIIEGNQILVPEGVHRGIYVGGSQNVVIRYNQISGAKEPIKVEHSENVIISENH